MNKIEFTPQEIAIIERYRGSSSKGALASIYDIFDAYNGTNNKNCWCSRLYREEMSMKFYKWYDLITTINE